MIKIKNLNYLSLALLLIFSACKEDDDETIPGQPPIADAGDDIEVTVGSAAALDGRGSSDPDGDALTFSWSISQRPDGSNASLSASSAQTTFTPDLVGTYQLQLSVSDGIHDPVTDLVTVEALEAIGDPPIAIIRDDDNREISEANENNEVTINTLFLLDGSNSSDPDSEDLTFSWDITESPEGSEATITPTEDEAMANFAPDLLGAYTVQLTVEDPEGNTTAATVALMATANPVVVDKNIDVATTWPNVFEDPNLPDYHVIVDLSLSEELTIAPGVKVMFEANRGMNISGNNGALIAEGLADSLIVFTAEDSVNGWDGIIIYNNNALNLISHADVSYGGNRNATSGVEPANIGIEGFANGRLKISNTIVSNSFGYGLYVEDGGVLSEFATNTFTNNTNHPLSVAVDQVSSLDASSTFSENGNNSVEIVRSTLNLNDEQNWPSLANSVSYSVSGILQLSSGLSITAGASFRFAPDTYLQVNDGGYIIAVGTESDSIVFTADEMSNGWGGLIFFSNDNRNELVYTSISYAGNRAPTSGVLPSSVGLEGFNGSKLKLTNSTISNSVGDYGLFVETGASLNTFSENTFRNNDGLPIALPITVAGVLDEASTFSGNGTDAVEIFKSTLNSDISLVTFTDGTPYFVSGKLDIDDDLTIAANNTLNIGKDVVLEVGESGSLNAVGDADNIITITAENTNDGWGGIIFFSNKATNELTFCDISYGGNRQATSGVEPANVGLEGFSNSKIKLTNSSLSNSFGYGLYVETGASVTDAGGTVLTNQTALEGAGNTFSNNTSGSSDFDL